jgi:crotonobetainyl-CoA:carnitine CoA-transferase CaiB-like acyl-CoA transferase
MSGLLAGVRVLDLTRLLPGPLCTWHLQSLGAEIIKIEAPAYDNAAGDYAKTMSDLDADGISYFYKYLNAGKQVLALDLKTAVGHARLLELVKTADAVIESFRPGVMARLALSHAQLAAVNPRINLISISGYGQTGPMSQAAGHDINYMAGSGMLHEFIGESGEPVLPNLQFGDVLGGALSAAFLTVSAILAAQRTGAGSHVDVSMTAQLQANVMFPRFETLAHGAPKAAGKSLLNGGVPCYGLYRTQDDRFLAVGALELKFWQALCDAIGRPDLRGAHWQLGQQVGGADAKRVRQVLQTLFAAQPLVHWLQQLNPFDCCVSPVLRIDEVLRAQNR